MYRLSYAKAAEMAPLVKKFLSPRGEVIFDARTNTLIVTDIED
jgi:type II secretory pathway component HofQ